MIWDLKGTVAGKGPETVVLDVGGVGIELSVTPAVSARLTEGERARLYTRLIVREDAISLYGFETCEERACFDLLLKVRGVGPKVALSALDRFRPDAFYSAVLASDEEALTRIPGVGRKTAGRIILELRDRIGLKPSKELAMSAPAVLGEACQALAALGYSRQEASLALEKLDAKTISGDLETVLREALKRLARV